MNMLRTDLNKKYDVIANNISVKYKVSAPNKPIAYPMGIPKIPYPKDEHIMKLAVFCFDSL
jgi:hypothetical protein